MHADVVVWATPIYYYEMSGQMKTLIDRMNACITWITNFEKSICLLQLRKTRSLFPGLQKLGCSDGLTVILKPGLQVHCFAVA